MSQAAGFKNLNFILRITLVFMCGSVCDYSRAVAGNRETEVMARKAGVI